MKTRYYLISVLLLASLVFIIGCDKYVKEKITISQTNFSECHNYLVGENDYVAQSFLTNLSTISVVSFRVTVTSDTELILSIFEDNLSGRKIFNGKKQIKQSRESFIRIDVPDVSIKKGKSYFLKLTCPTCSHKLSVPESLIMDKSKMVCLWYANGNPFQSGQYYYQSENLKVDDQNLDLMFIIEGRET